MAGLIREVAWRVGPAGQDQRLYRLLPPLEGVEYIIVSAHHIPAPWAGADATYPSTVIHASNEDWAVGDRILGIDDHDHEKALACILGYAVVG